jgi:hypothetical protein
VSKEPRQSLFQNFSYVCDAPLRTESGNYVAIVEIVDLLALTVDRIQSRAHLVQVARK